MGSSGTYLDGAPPLWVNLKMRLRPALVPSCRDLSAIDRPVSFPFQVRQQEPLLKARLPKAFARLARVWSPCAISAILLLLPLCLWAQLQPFAVIGDTHVGSKGSAYQTFIDALDKQGIDVIFHLGDAIDHPGSEAQWAEFQRITGPGKTVYLVPGNHDIDSRRSLAAYLKLFHQPYYSFSEEDTLFLLLNTELPGERGMVTGEQYAWLEGELRRPFRYKFVFLHEPLFPAFAGHGLDKYPETRDRLHDLFVRTGVSLVMAGHDHLYRRDVKEGVTYVIASGGGGRLYFSSLTGGFLHYVIGTKGDKGYSFVVKDMAGEVRDRFAIER
jgi:predicted phosphodiesterase